MVYLPAKAGKMSEDVLKQMATRRRRRRLPASDDNNGASAGTSTSTTSTTDKAFKICNVLGGLDVTRFVSRDARAFFAGAIDDVELIREVISEVATNGGVGNRITLKGLARSLDRSGREAANNSLPVGVETTVEAGMGYVDDSPDRRMEIYVSLAELEVTNNNTRADADGHKSKRRRYQKVEAELNIVQAASLIFPWIVDRKSKTEYWWVSHENGRSEGPAKEPFRFDALYSAAWIGSDNDAWAYYPPFNKKQGGGLPFNLGDALGDQISCRTCPFVEPNLPENNPSRRAFLTSPYPDVAQTGLSLISALAPVYFTGIFRNRTYDDEYIASTGLDIEVDSVSSLLDVVNGRLTDGSFGLLVDMDLNVLVIAQEVVEIIYPSRTGFEEERITYDVSDGTVLDDRRNHTYLVSDTIVQGLTMLENADWNGLKASLAELKPGERDFSTIEIIPTGERKATDFYVMFERWEYVADWALLVFAPVEEVDNAMKVNIVSSPKRMKQIAEKPHHSSNETLASNLMRLEVEKGSSLTAEASVENDGSLDVILKPQGTPHWIQLQSTIVDGQVLKAGDSLPLRFSVEAGALELGTTSGFITFNIRDDSYPDCFYNEEKSLSVSVRVLPQNCARITGDKLRVPDITGTQCVCKEIAVEIGGRCISIGILVPMIALPLLIVGIVLVFAYVERKRKQADSVWEVKSEELLYDDPPEVAGRGTFGLVLVAEYRGTTVAVKRVIPPRLRHKAKGRGSSSRRGSALNNAPRAPRRRRSSVLNVMRGPANDDDTLDLSNTSIRTNDDLFDFDEEGLGDDNAANGEQFDEEKGGDPKLPNARSGEKCGQRLSLGLVPGSFRRLSLHNDEETAPLTSGTNTRNPSNRRSSMGTVPSQSSYDSFSVPDSAAQNRRSSMEEVPRAGRSRRPSQRRLSAIDDGSQGKASQKGNPLFAALGSMSGSMSNFAGIQNLLEGESGLSSSTSSWGISAAFLNRRRHPNLRADFVQEMRALSKLRHPCIISVMGAVISKTEEPLLVMEYMDHGSLYDLLHNVTMTFEGETILSILRDISQGMRFLHSASPQIIHGDLKSANCLVDSRFRAKVSDFGFTVKAKVGASGTPYWMAPELLRKESSNTAASDVYSFGVMIYEMFSRKDPYEGEEFEKVIRNVCNKDINLRPPIPPSMPPEVATLLYSTALLPDPSARPTFQELDGFLKRFQAQNVEPDGPQIESLQMTKARDNQTDNSSRLLEEIFPPHVAAALREGRKVEPENFDMVTIFFSDIKGFTTISAEMSPQKVSDMLDRLYNKFDDLSHKHGVFKLETIGDAWMGVTNLFEACPDDHVKRIALFSIDAINAANETLIDYDDISKGFVEIRVGFHSGPVLANVVGSRLPKYSVFGDTVNTSSRMESNSLPMRIHCSDRSAELLRSQAPKIKLESRGVIHVKGKGDMETFWVADDVIGGQELDLSTEFIGKLKE